MKIEKILGLGLGACLLFSSTVYAEELSSSGTNDRVVEKSLVESKSDNNYKSVILEEGKVNTVKVEGKENTNKEIPIADKKNGQALPKICSTKDGGSYISWYQISTDGSYDLYIQRLDKNQNEEWPHNGIRIVDSNSTYVFDYEMTSDENNNAIITYNDDRFGGIQVGANKISPRGALLWGKNGLQLTATDNFIGSTKVVSTSDGNFVFAWTQEDSVFLQKVSPDGKFLWGENGLEQKAEKGHYFLSDIIESDKGSVIASYINPQGDGVGVYKTMLAQKFSSTGQPCWGNKPITIFDGKGLIPEGYFPEVSSDGNGGSIFSWFISTETSKFNSYAQRVSSTGQELFPHNGVLLSSDDSILHIHPTVKYNQSDKCIYAFWVIKNLKQDKAGIVGQKISPNGSLQWSNEGKILLPLGNTAISSINPVISKKGMNLFYNYGSYEAGSQQIMKINIDKNENFKSSQITTVASRKLHIDSTIDREGNPMITWEDTRKNPEGDIYFEKVSSK